MTIPNGVAAQQSQKTVPASQAQINLSFAPVVNQVADAVVSITTRKSVTQRYGQLLDDPLFNFFFRDYRNQIPQSPRDQTSLGSGVILGDDGLIVTNQHVVNDADEISVILSDRREFAAELIASDRRSDLAFLQMIDPPPKLPLIRLGNSDAIEVGDLALAIGNPFGIGQTVTSGIISAKSRVTPGSGSDVSFIQTDAAINPGNSGGALVGLDGRLLGINTAIFTRGGGSIGIGFAIPANLVKARMQSMDGQGGFLRPWLGARLQTIDTKLAQALKMDRPKGLLIRELFPGAAADRAGLRAGDAILTIAGFALKDAAEVNLRLSLQPMGARAEVELWRNGRTIRRELPIEPAPSRPQPNVSQLEGQNPLANVWVANLSPRFNEINGLDPFLRGVAIIELTRQSYARRLGLRKGDIISGINGVIINDVSDVQVALRQRSSRWQLSILRDGRTINMTVG